MFHAYLHGHNAAVAMLVPARASGSMQAVARRAKKQLKTSAFVRMSPFVDALKFRVSGKPACRLSYNAGGAAAVLGELEVMLVLLGRAS
jgi:hypothetical protein